MKERKKEEKRKKERKKERKKKERKMINTEFFNTHLTCKVIRNTVVSQCTFFQIKPLL